MEYEKWIGFVFDHPVEEPESRWYWSIDARDWDEDADPTVTASYLRRLFDDPAFLLKRFSRAQIAQGFDYLLTTGASSHMECLINPEVPLPLRTAAVRAMSNLYRGLFAVACDEAYSHLAEGTCVANELNTVCYMWWDLIVIWPQGTTRGSVDDTVLDVLKEILTIPHLACRESALHGLGHGVCEHGRRIREIIDDFLRRTEGIEPVLRRYALAARDGAIP